MLMEFTGKSRKTALKDLLSLFIFQQGYIGDRQMFIKELNASLKICNFFIGCKMKLLLLLGIYLMQHLLF